MMQTDDDYDVAYWAANHEAGHAIPAALRNCRGVHDVMNCFPENASSHSSNDLHRLAKELCPGSCPTYCKASTETSILEPTFFATAKLLRQSAVAATGLPPGALQDSELLE